MAKYEMESFEGMLDLLKARGIDEGVIMVGQRYKVEEGNLVPVNDENGDVQLVKSQATQVHLLLSFAAEDLYMAQEVISEHIATPEQEEKFSKKVEKKKDELFKMIQEKTKLTIGLGTVYI
jgi:hypothetical protein